MKDNANILEEYKFLREETKSFTDQSLRDLQMFLGILAILITLSSIKPEGDSDAGGILSFKSFWYFALIQAATFIFLVVQFIKIIYILEIRKHLRYLEGVLNAENTNDNYNLKWETVIVPKRLSNFKSYTIHGQVVIGFMYALFFLTIIGVSCQQIHEIDPSYRKAYYLILCIELVFLLYSVFRLVRIHFKQQEH
jgi:hypothetical protein